MIQLSFDRYLLPATVTRQSYAILDNLNQQLAPDSIRTVYDPIARTVTIVGPNGPGISWLTPGVDYKLVLGVPSNLNDTSDIGGFRAIDGTPLDPTQKLQYPFHAEAASGVTVIDPAVDFCADVLPIFSVKCGSPTCHGSQTGSENQAAASLLLTSGEAVQVTARGRVAQGSNTGARSFSSEPPGNLFGVDMAIIEPGDPGSSWLIYKLELAPPPAPGSVPVILCTPPAGAAPIPAPAAPYQSLAPIRPVADVAERAVLSEFILGQAMPYPSPIVQYETEPLSFLERERIRIWIANGATTRDCGGCGELATSADAGAH